MFCLIITVNKARRHNTDGQMIQNKEAACTRPPTPGGGGGVGGVGRLGGYTSRTYEKVLQKHYQPCCHGYYNRKCKRRRRLGYRKWRHPQQDLCALKAETQRGVTVMSHHHSNWLDTTAGRTRMLFVSAGRFWFIQTELERDRDQNRGQYEHSTT